MLRKVQDYIHMLQPFNYIPTTALEFNEPGMVGMPINTIVDAHMRTKSGNAAFLNPKVKTIFKKILNEWARFLGSSDSTSVLNVKKDGWFNRHALEVMRHASRRLEKWNFGDDYICDPNAPHYGFTSSDGFFIWRSKEGVRNVRCQDDDNVIVNACGGAPYAISNHVKALDKFWLNEVRSSFTVSSICLTTTPSYKFRRWGGVSGFPFSDFLSRVACTCLWEDREGRHYTGYVFLGSQVYDWPHLDPDDPDSSQGYIAAIATRAVVFINQKIGLMCVVFIGMAEVSTCDIRVHEGQNVTKGEEVGMFHFSGLTYFSVSRQR
jgi:phosphatidylserine decarboxylase